MAEKNKMKIKLKSYDHALLDVSCKKIIETVKRTGAEVAGPIPMPTKKEVVTILRAVNRYKDSREQFEMRIHKRLIEVIRPSGRTIESLQGLDLAAGVEVEMTEG